MTPNPIIDRKFNQLFSNYRPLRGQNIVKRTAISHFLATKNLQLMLSPALFAIETSRKADIDATRGGFELPTNSKNHVFSQDSA